MLGFFGTEPLLIFLIVDEDTPERTASFATPSGPFSFIHLIKNCRFTFIEPIMSYQITFVHKKVIFWVIFYDQEMS